LGEEPVPYFLLPDPYLLIIALGLGSVAVESDKKRRD
jgi:hypothetical protein